MVSKTWWWNSSTITVYEDNTGSLELGNLEEASEHTAKAFRYQTKN